MPELAKNLSSLDIIQPVKILLNRRSSSRRLIEDEAPLIYHESIALLLCRIAPLQVQRQQPAQDDVFLNVRRGRRVAWTVFQP
jgi:hypothetical protein